MAYEIRGIEEDRHNSYEVRYSALDGSTDRLVLYATDELGAYTEALKILGRKKANMKTFIMCATLMSVFILTSVVYSCDSSRANYATNMNNCVIAGKSYVSEDGGYSCRDVIVRRKTNG